MDPEAIPGDGHLAESVAFRRRSQSFSDDYSVQRTNDDATLCKFSAVQLKYWEDPFIKRFAVGVEANSRRDPEISIGYWARVSAVYTLLTNFIEETGGNCQIVSLGCGFDTLFWRLKQDAKKFVRFVDVDFSSVTSRKIRHIRKPGSDLLQYFSQSPQEEQHCDLHCGDYHLVGADLRQWEELKMKLDGTGLSKDIPTFFLAECVLVYMSADQSATLLKNIAEYFNTAVFLNYEQYRTSDVFGKVMESNLEQRGLQLPGLSACQDKESQKNRFTENGWKNVVVADMETVYKKFLPDTEVERIQAIERLDEMELLHQLLEHYCLVHAICGKDETEVERLRWRFM